MSKKTHQQQRDRARAKRESDRLERRKKRSQIVVITMVVLLVLSLVGAALAGLVGGGGDQATPEVEDELEELLEQAQEESGPPADLEPCPPATDAPEPAELSYDEVPDLRIAEDAEVTATFVTTCGEVVVELLPGDAPVAVGNFVSLALDGYYDGTPFHRTMWDFVVQGGDPAGDGTGGPGYEFEDELDLPATFAPDPEGRGAVQYPRGTLAMANRGPDTNGSQFFIVQADPSYPFPPAYTVFGRVLDGLDVVDRIAAGEQEGSIAVDPVIVTEVRIDGLPDEAPTDDADGDDEGSVDADEDAADGDADAAEEDGADVGQDD